MVLFAPSATFEDVRERPRWLVPLLVIAGLTLILSYFMLSAVLRDAADRDDGPRHDGGAEGSGVRQMEQFKYVGLAFGPIMVAVISALVGLLMWAWAAISGARDPRYKVAFTAIVYTGSSGSCS